MRFFTRTRPLTLLLAMLVALAIPATALAQGEEVIRDCAQDGDLDGDYSQEELDDAYNNLPSDIDEYSDCRSVIEKARERGGTGGTNNDAGSSTGASVPGGSSGGGGDELGGSRNDTEELQSRDKDSKSGNAPDATFDGKEATSSGGTFDVADDSGGMPLPLIVAIILAVLAALLGGVYLLRERLPGGIASRLPGFFKA